jgi:hypothetical protein
VQTAFGFYREYPMLAEKVPQAVALLPKQTLKDRYIFDFLTLESLTFA